MPLENIFDKIFLLFPSYAFFFSYFGREVESEKLTGNLTTT